MPGCDHGHGSDRPRAGRGQAFRQLVEPYQRELQVHCYRILGSAQDAEDAMQETLFTAWRSLSGFEQRSSLRTWLLPDRHHPQPERAAVGITRRPVMEWSNRDVDPPDPTRLGEVPWLEPYPDVLLAWPSCPTTPPARRRATRYREAISLAFVTALQVLPPGSAPP